MCDLHTSVFTVFTCIHISIGQVYLHRKTIPAVSSKSVASSKQVYRVVSKASEYNQLIESDQVFLLKESIIMRLWISDPYSEALDLLILTRRLWNLSFL